MKIKHSNWQIEPFRDVPFGTWEWLYYGRNPEDGEPPVVLRPTIKSAKRLARKLANQSGTPYEIIQCINHSSKTIKRYIYNPTISKTN